MRAVDASGATVDMGDSSTVAYVANNPNAQYITAGYGALATGGRNTLALRPINNFDLQIKKVFAIGEVKRLEFGAQLFNALNHPQYTAGYTNNVLQTQTLGASQQNILIPGNPLVRSPRPGLQQQPPLDPIDRQIPVLARPHARFSTRPPPARFSTHPPPRGSVLTRPHARFSTHPPHAVQYSPAPTRFSTRPPPRGSVLARPHAVQYSPAPTRFSTHPPPRAVQCSPAPTRGSVLARSPRAVQYSPAPTRSSVLVRIRARSKRIRNITKPSQILHHARK